MIISTWHSIDVQPDMETAAVHHHNTTCKAGQKVAKNRRRHGTDNRPLCEECARADEAGL
jgi:hypothetical protein